MSHPSIDDNLEDIRTQFDNDLRRLRNQYLGKHSKIDGLLQRMGSATASERASAGRKINTLVAYIRGRTL